MKINRVSYIALAAFAFAASCSKEAAEPDVYDWTGTKIYIRPSIANVVGTRAQDMTLDRLDSFQVTCFNHTVGDLTSADYSSPYFKNVTFIRKPNNTFEATPDETQPTTWPSPSGRIDFFAFSPSMKELGEETEPVGNDSGFRLDKVHINSDISRQSDFITAGTSGERNDFYGGVDLNFRHQLCQVELRAWGSGDYEFDIAGVRIGNSVVEDAFVFVERDGNPDSRVKTPRWESDGDGVKGKVEYLYQIGDSFNSPDSIFSINGEAHNTSDSAASIMGKGGCAMVIPTVNERWEGLDDPDIAVSPYKTEKMYFSILLRVKNPETGLVVYPYPGNPYHMAVASYAVDADGKVIRQLYKGENDGEYFTDSQKTNHYVAPEGEEVMDFGWAAVPVDADWSAGKKYIYTLDYSEGIGIHDPDDPEPGKLIVGQLPVEWSVTVSGWNYATPDENFTPDIDAP